MRRAILGILLLVGCGSSDGGLTADESAVQGVWLLQLDAYVVLGASFNADRTYQISTIATLTTGAIGLEAELGTFTADAGRIVFTPEEWSCRGSDPPYFFTFSATATNLRLTTASGVLVFEKVTPGSGSGAATFGCFASDGTFTAQPLAPVQ